MGGPCNFSLQLATTKQTTVYTEGLFAQKAGAATPNLNSILVLPNSPTTIIGDGRAGPNSMTPPFSSIRATRRGFVNADVQVDNNTHRCQMLMLVVPST